MEQVSTLTFDGWISADNRVRLVVDGLQKDIVRSWIGLRNMLVAKRVPTRPAVKPLSDYYAGAYERASAATPITSFGQLL